MKIELTDRDATVLRGVLTTRLGERRVVVRRVCALLSSAVAER